MTRFFYRAAGIALFACFLFPALGQTADLPETLLTIEPSEQFPRNSEGDLVELKDGSLCLVYTRFTGGGADNAAADIVARFSKDDGKTWGEDRVLVKNEGVENTMSVSLIRLKETGEILLFYLVKNGWCDLLAYVRRSTDELQTVGERVLATVTPAYHVVNNDRIVPLSSGRLIIPAAIHPCTKEGGRDSWGANALMRTYFSDDGGASWEAGQSEEIKTSTFPTTLQEPGIVELKDGRLWMYIRTDGGFQYESFSSDQGLTWTTPEPGNLASPLSPATIERIPWSGDLLAVWNDHSGWHKFPAKKRTPLCVAISKDDGKTWSPSRMIEGDPEGWYCYTAILFQEDRVVLAYCAGDKDVGGLNRLKVTALPRKWLEMSY